MAYTIVHYGETIEFEAFDTYYDDECVRGSGVLVITQDVGIRRCSLGLICQIGFGSEVLHIADTPVHFITAWRAAQALQDIERLRFCDGKPISLDAFNRAMASIGHERMLGALAADFNMSFIEFGGYMKHWRSRWLELEDLDELKNAG